MKNLKKLTIPININAGYYLFNTGKLEELKLTKGTTGLGYDYATVYSNRTPWYYSREIGGASSTSIGTNPLKVTIGSDISKIGNYTFYNAYRVQLQSSISGITIGSNAFTNSGANIN